jgi:hypothetical protein
VPMTDVNVSLHHKEFKSFCLESGRGIVFEAEKSNFERKFKNLASTI